MREGKHAFGPGPRTRLVLLSFLMLFVELALIRWTGAHVAYLAFFANFVLLASFLGIGVGFLRARASRDLFPWAPVALVCYVAFVLAFSVEGRLTPEPHVAGYFGLPALPRWAMLPALFVGAAATMALIGEGVARTFARFEPLEAYRLDILGSILGIGAFSLVSLTGMPPAVWGSVAAALLALLAYPGLTRAGWAALGGLVLLLGVESLLPFDQWSPYYRVTVGAPRDGVVDLRVNGLPHQSIQPVSRLRVRYPFYFEPYERAPANALEDVLIVGAGTGNDVAVALDRGAGRIHAVEIDPLLYRLGRDRHPDRPYQDPRVRVEINDGRAVLEQTDRRYDLVLFALPDSLTLVSGQSSLRLESYLFTKEAIGEVRDHLKPGGAFALYNYYSPAVLDRFASTVAGVFGHPPCLGAGETLGNRRQVVLTVGLNTRDVACQATWRPAGGALAGPATDDRPFPYLVGRAIPPFYVATLLLIVGTSALIIRVASGPLRPMARYLDLFFMGAAFLLLETKNVVQFALLFGTTWLVNALVFVGILLTVFAAIEVARRWRPARVDGLYALLFGVLALAWAVPQEVFLQVALVPRFLAATALAFAPVFLANLVFAQRFRDVGSSTTAFGANLLGSMIGGVLEYGALVVGHRSLLLAVAVLYALAYALGRSHLAQDARVSVRAPEPG
jgi:SAM-dependent methyltransferase